MTQSDVTVNMLLILGGRWRVLGKMLRAVPRFVRNAAYRMFARNRYRLAGQYDVCPVPPEAVRMKFVGSMVLRRQCFLRGAVSPVVDCVADGGGGQVAAAHLVFGNTAQGFGYRLLGDGVCLVDGLA